MRKLNMGYSKYFNNKYSRKGTLFEGRYKSIAVTREKHFLHLPYYIHCNPLDLTTPEWRVHALKNPRESIDFLKEYRWSSHIDYLGEKNFPSVTDRGLLLDFFGGHSGYKDDIEKWLLNPNVGSIEKIILE